jgi:predicted ATPase
VAARDVAAEITDASGAHLGVGLALDVPGRGPVVITCHHVVAPMPPDAVRVRYHDGSVRAAVLDEAATRIERDAAVLTVTDPPHTVNPRLHAPAPERFAGPLDGLAYSPGASTGTFKVTLDAGDFGRVINVPYEPRRYTVPEAYLLKVDDSREGVSGSPVDCESGIVGLVHAARDESAGAARVGYAGPITAWLDGLPGLEQLIEPFVTQTLRDHATVYWATVAPERPELRVRGRRASYLERPEDQDARRAFERGALCLVGRHNTGKSRLVGQLLHDNPDAVVVLPGRMAPPDLTKESDLRGRRVILLFDNIHIATAAWRPLEWLDRFSAITERVTLIVTAWNADWWGKVSDVQGDLFEVVGSVPVFLGETEGRDLDEEEGWHLAQQIGMDRATFELRFDGTPGSLLDDADAPPPQAEILPDGERAGTEIHTVTAEQMPADVPTNLPTVTSSFVGRKRELVALRTLLDAAALVTLTGPRGVGKTRLAVRAAWTFARDYPEGVWYVDLSATRYEHQVADILARSVGAGRRAFAGLDEALAERLRGERSLIVLNGCEHVQAAAAAVAARLTEGDPALRVLVTAETRLGVPWESVLALKPLTPSREAKRLFFARSGLEDVSRDDRSAAEPLYKELRGNAAALEIAAAQVRSSGVRRTVDARRRGGAGKAADVLRLAVLSSLQDLTEAEAALFARLAAMPDWFTLAAARAVAAGDPVDDEGIPQHLRALVDRSLVLIDARDAGGQRFRFLPSVREIAAERLDERGEREPVSRRHAEHYLRVAEQADRRLQGREARRWLARLEAEQQHLRAALRWSIEHDRSLALRLSSALWIPNLMRSNFAEARRWIAEVVDRAIPEQLTPADVPVLANVVIAGGYLAYHQADYVDAERLLELLHDVQRRPGAGPTHGDDVNLRGLIARRRCRFDEAMPLLAAAADASREERDLARLADRLNTMGNAVRECCGDLAEALRRQEQSLGTYVRLGDLRGSAMVQCDLAYVLLDRGGHDDEARRLLDESLATRKRIKDAQGVGQSLNGLGRLEREDGAAELAIRHHRQALELFEDMGDALRVAETLEALALADAREAPAHLDRAAAVRERLGAPRPPVLTDALDRIARTDRFRRERRRRAHASGGQPSPTRGVPAVPVPARGNPPG